MLLPVLVHRNGVIIPASTAGICITTAIICRHCRSIFRHCQSIWWLRLRHRLQGVGSSTKIYLGAQPFCTHMFLPLCCQLSLTHLGCHKWVHG